MLRMVSFVMLLGMLSAPRTGGISFGGVLVAVAAMMVLLAAAERAKR